MNSRASRIALAGLIVGAACAVSGIALACGTGKVLFEDKFEALDPSWNIPATAGAAGKDGLSVESAPNTVFNRLNQSSLYDNYEVCITYALQFGDPQSNSAVAILFWGADTSNYYGFFTSPVSGSYALWRVQRGKWLNPIAWTPSPVVTKGAGSLNEVSVKVVGNKGTLTINNQKVTDFTGQPPENGSLIGFELDTGGNDKSPSTLVLKSIEVREAQ
jgi:3-keto-disaccharide hydrolase